MRYWFGYARWILRSLARKTDGILVTPRCYAQPQDDGAWATITAGPNGPQLSIATGADWLDAEHVLVLAEFLRDAWT
jgi:hypothetical protein